MKTFEKYIDAIIQSDCGYEDGQLTSCKCEKCDFGKWNGNECDFDKYKKFLLSEYEEQKKEDFFELIELSKVEYYILNWMKDKDKDCQLKEKGSNFYELYRQLERHGLFKNVPDSAPDPNPDPVGIGCGFMRMVTPECILNSCKVVNEYGKVVYESKRIDISNYIGA